MQRIMRLITSALLQLSVSTGMNMYIYIIILYVKPFLMEWIFPTTVCKIDFNYLSFPAWLIETNNCVMDCSYLYNINRWGQREVH